MPLSWALRDTCAPRADTRVPEAAARGRPGCPSGGTPRAEPRHGAPPGSPPGPTRVFARRARSPKRKPRRPAPSPSPPSLPHTPPCGGLRVRPPSAPAPRMRRENSRSMAGPAPGAIMAEDYFGNTAEWGEEADGGQVRAGTGPPLTGLVRGRRRARADRAGASGGRAPARGRRAVPCPRPPRPLAPPRPRPLASRPSRSPE